MSPNEPKRAQTNPNEPKRTQTNCKFDFRFDTLFRFAPGCAKLRPSSTFLRSSCTPQIGRNMSECYVSDVETGQNWKSSVEIGNPAWVKLLHPKPTTNRSEFSNFRPLYVIRALKKATSLTRQRCRYLGGQHTEQSGHVWSIIYNHGEKNHSTWVRFHGLLVSFIMLKHPLTHCSQKLASACENQPWAFPIQWGSFAQACMNIYSWRMDSLWLFPPCSSSHD